jgi:uncharacterized membrane protein
MTQEPTNFWQVIEYSPIGDFVATSGWAFPTIETIHVIALVTVIGTIAVMDLRMLGLASRNTPLTRMSQDTLWITWGAFTLALITGLLLFASKASTYMINPYFLIKMGLLVLAGLNMGYFHFVTWKKVAQWDTAAQIPVAVKVAGALSLTFWVLIVFFGRAIGFTLGMFY